jgi:hypothetical protein
MNDIAAAQERNLKENKPFQALMRANIKIHEYIESLTAGNFTGKVRLTFDNGKVVHMIQEKMIKP